MPWSPDYCSATELAAYMRVDDAVDATLYASWATAASRAIDKHCGRQFGQLLAAEARIYRRPPAYDARSGLWFVEIDDLQTALGLTINGVAFASSGAVLLPDNAISDSRPWDRLGFTDAPDMPMTVVARWGWAAVPSQVVTATKVQGARFAIRRDSPYGISGSPDAGNEMRILSRLDPDVKTLLLGLSRRRRVA